MKKRKYIFGLACLLLFVGILFRQETYAKEKKYGDFRYETEGNEAIITGYKGKKTKLVVPDTIHGKKVTALFTDEGTSDYRQVKKLVLGKNIDYIETRGVETGRGSQTGSGYEWSSLESITVRKKNKTYLSYDGCLYQKEGKKKVWALWCPRSKKGEVRLYKKTTYIPYNLFVDCKKITKIRIPKTVRKIEVSSYKDHVFEYESFYGCDRLKSIVVSPKNRWYKSKNGVLYNKEMTELIYCPQRIANCYRIPKNVKIIKCGAFGANSRLKKVVIPASVKEVEHDAFFKCSNVTSFIVEGKTKIPGSCGLDWMYDLKSLVFYNNDTFFTSLETDYSWGEGDILEELEQRDGLVLYIRKDSKADKYIKKHGYQINVQYLP